MGQGKKAKILGILDKKSSDESSLVATYCIEVTFARSPKRGVKCGAITVFRLNAVDLDFDKHLNPKNFTPAMLKNAAQVAQEIQDDLSQQTESMHMDPIIFRETDGQWIDWAIKRALSLFDSYGSSARMVVKCPMLEVRCERTPAQVAAMRSDYDTLFPVLRGMDKLLAEGYAYDPWSQTVRRGRVDAAMSKR